MIPLSYLYYTSSIPLYYSLQLLLVVAIIPLVYLYYTSIIPVITTAANTITSQRVLTEQ